jgi:uncharacterized protein (TIGR02677 family)
MNITEELTMPLKEVNYLNVDNTKRYRPILRFFYINHEQMKYWLNAEDVYDEISKHPFFGDYTMDQCLSDLNALVNWGNLSTIQDTRNISTIEEFKNRKFRYQMTERAIAVERMVIHLENLSVESASLEPNLIERIKRYLVDICLIKDANEDEIYSWWRDLNHDFLRLNQNYQDYMLMLNSAKADELMKAKEFLVYKDNLVGYLRDFIVVLQKNITPIEQKLKAVSESDIAHIIDVVTKHEFDIPKLNDNEVDIDTLRGANSSKFNNIYTWFVSKNGNEAEINRVLDATNDVIRRITRYANRISENINISTNRRKEYRHIADLFMQCEDIKDAHILSSYVFGIKESMHLKGRMLRESDSINQSVYDEQPFYVELEPRVRTYKTKAHRNKIIDRSKEKEEIRRKNLERIKNERKMIDKYINNDKVELSKLAASFTLEPNVRDVILTWISKALERSNKSAVTEDGVMYHLELKDGERCMLKSTDGVLDMPAYTIVFDREVVS